MLGHGEFDKTYYNCQTIKDNVKLLTPEILDEINQIVVAAGHNLCKKKELRTRCDSFVVETNIHYPTDINLLFDAMRKAIKGIAKLYNKQNKNEWRQSEYNIKCIKKSYRIAQQSKKGGSKDPDKKHEKQKKAHFEYIALCEYHLNRIHISRNELQNADNLALPDIALLNEVKSYYEHAIRQVDQIQRRVLQDQIIPHSEKVFSLFEPYSEWICKGKAGVPFELGLKVCIIEDQHQFILHHHIMQDQSDSEIAVMMVEEAQKRFSDVISTSYDRGFYSSKNRATLQKELTDISMPKKGKKSANDKEIEKSESFHKAKSKHSAVESAINALEEHGLDQCPDRGIDGFKRYVALAITSRNIQRIGAIIVKKEQRLALLHRERYRKKAA